MEKYNIYPNMARALGNVMNTKGTWEEIDCVYCETTHPVLVNNMSVEYDGINWPIFKMEVDSSLYNITIALTASKTSLAINESTKLTATVKDSKNNPLKNLTLKFYLDNSYVSSAETDNNGVATKNMAFASLGTRSLKVIFEGSNRYNTSTSNTLSLNVNQKLSTNITNFIATQNSATILPNPDNDYVCNSSPVTLSWDVKDSANNNISNGVCEVYRRGSLVQTLNAGVNTYVIPTASIEEDIGYTYQIKLKEGETYNGTSSDVIGFVGVEYKEPVINATISKEHVVIGESCTITGTVIDQHGSPLKNIPVNLYCEEYSGGQSRIDQGIIATAETNNNGVVTFNLLNDHLGGHMTPEFCGRWWYTLRSNNADCRASAISSELSLTMDILKPTLSVSVLNIYEGYCKVQATLKNGNVGIVGKTLFLGYKNEDNWQNMLRATTDDNGVAIFDLTGLKAKTLDLIVHFYPPTLAYEEVSYPITFNIIEDNQLTITNFVVSTSDGTINSPICCINPREMLTFTGTVKTSQGNIVQGLQVNFLLDDTTIVSGLTNSQGKVSVSDTAPGSGSYTVKAVVPNSGKYIGCSKEDALIIIEDSTTRACEDYVS